MLIFNPSHWSRWLLLYLLLFSTGTHVLGETQSTEPAFSDENPVYLALWNQARELQLFHHPYWLKLLHFYSFGESVGQWSFKSDVVNDGFFLSPDGKTDPSAELKATLKAVLSPLSKDPNQHARCKFIARFNWLRSSLDFPELPKLACPLFERWSNLEEATGISIVFVSAYLKNPASTFGHLLLKFNSRNRHFGHSLLRPTLNYGAMINPDDNPFIYALRGLFGGYEGSFTDERFYNFNHIYGENESRDLWEYPLNLTPDQQYLVTFHAWELLQKVQFTYYFFLDNCAYRMAELLEMAWTDTTRINTSGAIWSIPVDVVFKLKKFKRNTEGPPLLGSPKLIPSRQRKLQQRVAQLNEAEQEQLRKLIEYTNNLDSEEFLSFPEPSRALILDALLDYQQYKKIDNLTLQQQKERTKLLLVRSKLPVLVNNVSSETSKSPTEGTPPMRFRLGTVFNGLLGPALEVGTWANYHDLLGDESGHLQNAEVVTLDLRLRFRENSFELTQFQLFNIQKFALNPTGIFGDYEWSWRARGGWEREHYGCSPCREFRITGGFGRSVSFGGKDVELVFVDLFGETKKNAWSATTWGYAPHLGMMWSPIDIWKIRFEGGWFKSFSGPKREYFRIRFDQRLTITQDWDIRMEIEQFESLEGTLALHYFW